MKVTSKPIYGISGLRIKNNFLLNVILFSMERILGRRSVCFSFDTFDEVENRSHRLTEHFYAR